VIKDIDDCTAVYSEDERDDGFLMTLIVNDKANYFVKMLDDTDFGDNYQDRLLFPEVPQNELRSRVKQLQKQGYTELWYSVYADEWVNRE
jgi:hypothetical protein